MLVGRCVFCQDSDLLIAGSIDALQHLPVLVPLHCVQDGGDDRFQPFLGEIREVLHVAFDFSMGEIAPVLRELRKRR